MTIHWQEIRTLRKSAQGLHRTLKDEPITWEIYEGIADFLLGYLQPYMKTLETGVGLSTLLFAKCQTQHIAITPDPDEINRLCQVISSQSFSTTQIEFKIGQSEYVLPSLPQDPLLDLILIDGGHGFPTPFVDWFFSASRLKTGGIVIIDDINLPTVFQLYQFLVAHPHWQLVQNQAWQAAIFRKISPHAGRSLEDWYHQPWLGHIHWPRWLVYFFWAPLTGNTVWQRRSFHFLHQLLFYRFFSPIYHYFIYYFIAKIYFHFLVKIYYHIFVKIYYFLFIQIPLYLVSYARKCAAYGKTAFYFYGLRKTYFHGLLPLYYHGICPIYWYGLRPIPILIKSYSRKMIAYTVTLIWTLRIPDLPGLTRMWFWKCIPLWARRQNLYRLWQKYILGVKSNSPHCQD